MWKAFLDTLCLDIASLIFINTDDIMFLKNAKPTSCLFVCRFGEKRTVRNSLTVQQVIDKLIFCVVKPLYTKNFDFDSSSK